MGAEDICTGLGARLCTQEEYEALEAFDSGCKIEKKGYPVWTSTDCTESGGEKRKGSMTTVLPLGAAINMDGTSLGFPVMVVFAHQMGEELTKLVDGQDVPYIDGGMMFGDMLFVAFLAMVCSLGTAPIPNAGLVYLTMLLEAGNIPEGIHGLALSAITIFDWLVDRVETAQNVGSDSFISSIIAVRMKDKMDMQMALNDGSGATAADEKL